MKGLPATARAVGRAVGLFGLLYVRSSQASSTEIIGSDGKEYAYHGLRHRPAHRHHHHGAEAKRHHQVRMLNHQRHRRVPVNVTVEDVSADIPHSHIAIPDGNGPHASHRPGNSRMELMHARWCAGLTRDAPQFGQCVGFMGTVCNQKSGQEDSTETVKGLCAKFHWTAGQAVQFHGGGSRDSSAGSQLIYAPAPSPDMVVGMAPAPMGEGFQAMVPGAFPAPAPSSMEMREMQGPRAKFGRVNNMDESVMMPEQGFSGKPVAHDDSHTRVEDWQREYGPKADMMSYEDICAKYPRNEWCRMNSHLRIHRGRHSVVEKVKKSMSDVSDTVKSTVSDASDSVKSSAKHWHERLKDALGDAFKAPERKGAGSDEEEADEESASRGSAVSEGGSEESSAAAESKRSSERHSSSKGTSSEGSDEEEAAVESASRDSDESEGGSEEVSTAAESRRASKRHSSKEGASSGDGASAEDSDKSTEDTGSDERSSSEDGASADHVAEEGSERAEESSSEHAKESHSERAEESRSRRAEESSSERAGEGAAEASGGGDEDGEAHIAPKARSEVDADVDADSETTGSRQTGGADAHLDSTPSPNIKPVAEKEEQQQDIPVFGAPGDGGGESWWWWPWSSLVHPVAHAMTSALS